MDYFCLAVTAMLFHRRQKPWRMIPAAVLGGVYGVAVLFFTEPAWLGFLLDVTVELFLCAVAFAEHGQHFKRWLLLAGAFAVISALLGGIMTAFYSIFNRFSLWEGEGEPMSHISWFFLLLAILSGGITIFAGSMLRRSAAHRHCEIILTLRGKTVTLDGICDSGNTLSDPMSGRPVIVINRDCLRELLPYRMLHFFDCDVYSLETLPHIWKTKVRLLPSHTALGSGMLLGILPDQILIREESGQIHETDAIFAPADLQNGTCAPDALVPFSLFQ